MKSFESSLDNIIDKKFNITSAGIGDIYKRFAVENREAILEAFRKQGSSPPSSYMSDKDSKGVESIAFLSPTTCLSFYLDSPIPYRVRLVSPF